LARVDGGGDGRRAGLVARLPWSAGSGAACGAIVTGAGSAGAGAGAACGPIVTGAGFAGTEPGGARGPIATDNPRAPPAAKLTRSDQAGTRALINRAAREGASAGEGPGASRVDPPGIGAACGPIVIGSASASRRIARALTTAGR